MRATKGAMQMRPKRAAQVRAWLRFRAQPSGSSPKVIVIVTRGGVRPLWTRIEIQSPRCRRIKVMPRTVRCGAYENTVNRLGCGCEE